MAFPFESSTTTAVASGKDGVSYVRPDLAENFDDYDLIADCLKGAGAVKKKNVKYLPMPDPSNQSDENVARYGSYLQRAVFYNVTQRTALGLQGQIFVRAPVAEYPKALENVITDSNGSGISFEQLARDAVWYVESFGRCGVFIDYPNRAKAGAVSKADLASGNVRPTVTIYGPKNVINWREKVIGSKKVYELVVLVEEYTVQDNGFETVKAVQLRELRLSEDNRYSVQVWRQKTPKPAATDPQLTNGPAGVGLPLSAEFEKFEDAYFPVDGAGKPLDAIPFCFVGSKNNESSIDPPPLLDMAHINIAHYCNSADYEEMIYLVGQPMLVLSGITERWYKEILKQKVPFGSRNGLALNENAKAELLQVEPNTAAKEGMDSKERQMVALGAKIVEQREVQRTATEAGNETAAEESTLSAVAKNVSSAMKWALEWCAVFQNVQQTGIKYELNTDFELSRLSSEEIAAVIKGWQDNALSWTEMRNILRKAGRATLDDKKARKEIDKDAQKAIEQAAAEIGATTKAVADNTPPVET